MAQKVRVELLDDMDESKADETVTFGLRGVSYEIDLSAKNVQKLEKAMAPFLEVGRRMGKAPKAKRSSSGSSSGGATGMSKSDLTEVREWARANGYEVSDRGRISAQVQEAYSKAH